MVGRGLVIVPKLIHPLPPPILSPENSPEHSGDDAWMQVTTQVSVFVSKSETHLVLEHDIIPTMYTSTVFILACEREQVDLSY